jgi:AAHS family 4-hydroxybenzoate transporter-like MFS transporter
VVAQLPPGPVFRQLFLIGGLAPLGLAALIALGLPESVAFLIQSGRSRRRIASLVRQIDPNVKATEDYEFVLAPRPPEAPVGYAALFAGDMALITPLLWVMFTATLLSIFMLTSWMPLLLEASGFSAKEAATTNSLFQIGGAVGGVLVAFVLARIGVRLVAGLFLLCLASVAFVARAHVPDTLLALAIGVCGMCLIGSQAALNATAGLAYPTEARSRGLGMALGVGRVGSVVGPLLAGVMVAEGVTSARDLFLLPLIPLALGAVAAFVVASRLDLRRAAGSRA